MMNAAFGSHALGAPATGYATDTLLDGLSRQLSTLTNRRLSRGSNGPLAGNPMRITKPRSANNSPRSSMLQSRRRTLVNDGHFHPLRAQPALDSYYMAAPNSQPSPESMPDSGQRSARPLSWHPSSQLSQTQAQIPQPQQQQEQLPLMHYPYAPYTEADLFTNLRNFPPTPAAYSGYTSPASAFSPMSLPYSEFEQQPPYFSPMGWAVPAPQQPAAVLPLSQPTQEPESDFSQRSQPGQPSSALEWNAFATHGFDRCTAPPTPQYFVQAPQPEPKLQSEESIPYEPLEDEDSDSEILYGLGLYDTPEKQAADPQADYHRSVVSSLLGGTFTCPEPTGKGLKLEDAWEPPANDDDDESQDGSDDAEGDEQDDEQE